MYIERGLAAKLTRGRMSVLLLGPRQTGKSTLVRSLEPAIEINLADEETYADFLRDPGLLKRVSAGKPSVFVDEVQRIPSLLNTVQFLLDGKNPPKFYLTGSSARKLKRGRANLLPGRVLAFELGPFAASELGARFDVQRALEKGLLPGIYLEEDRETWTKLLRSYAATYLREEIQAEALTRNLEGFARFFEIVSSRSGDFADYSKIASQASLERMTARRYFDVLADTLVTRTVESFTKSRRRRLIQHPRHYLFDVGVLNGALGNFRPSPDRCGMLFEHLVLQLLAAEFAVRDEEVRFSVYRTEGGAEVDFIVERGPDLHAVEVKASRRVGQEDLRGLKSFGEFYQKRHEAIVVYLGEREQDFDGVRVLPLAAAIRAIAG